MPYNHHPDDHHDAEDDDDDQDDYDDHHTPSCNLDENRPDLILRRSLPIYTCSQVQVEEMVFYRVHNSALSTYHQPLTPPTQHYYVRYKV